MRSSRRLPGRALVVLLLLAAGAASWWWLGEQRAVAPVADTPRHPESYFRELDVIRHGEDGKPEMRLEAAYAESFEDETWIHLRDLRAHGMDKAGWLLIAGRGRMSEDGVLLEVRDNVQLLRMENDSEMQLRTDALDVNTETEIATTAAAVTITHGSGEISGRGLWVSLADDRLRIESEVEARYGK